MENDTDLDPARRIMQRMVNTPPKPHKGPEKGKAVIGYSDEAVEAPASLQAVMAANSQALDQLTTKARD